MMRPDGTPHSGEMDGWEADGCPLSIATAGSVKVTEWGKTHQMPWARLILDHRVYASKEDAPLWSPVILGDSMARRADSVVAASALVYDFDGGTEWGDVVDVLEAFGVRFWAYTTWSHTEDHHKFRVVLGLDEAIPAADFRRVWSGFRAMMGWQVDEGCKDISRLYYVPSCPSASPSPWQHWGGETCIDWRALLAADDAAPKAPQPMHVVAMRKREEDQGKRATANRNAFRRCLDRYSADVMYPQWIAIGMIAKEEGWEDEFIAWCKTGAKYVPGEPERKLRSIKR